MTEVTHIAFRCRDMKAQEQFYTRHFGMKRARVFHHGKKNQCVLLKLDGVRMELFQAPEEHKDAAGGEQPIGFMHLAFAVADIESAVRKLKDDGIEPESVIHCDALVPGMCICFFNDPEGNRVELMQGYSDEECPPED